MDLKKERQIKFWLTTVSKVLIIALVLFKLWDVAFDKGKETPKENKNLEHSSLQENITLDTLLKENPKNKKELADKPKISSHTPTQNKISNNTNVNKKLAYANITLVEDSFIWYRDKGQVVLKINNTTETRATNINITAFFKYGEQTESATFQGKNVIESHGVLSMYVPLSGVSKSKLPDAITLCISHESENLEKKNWYNYTLGNKVSRYGGAIELRSIVYKVLSASNSFYTGNPPNCAPPSSKKKTVPPVITNNTIVKNSDSSIEEKIRSTAKLFINGLNSKSLITVKSTSTDRLYKHFSTGDYKNYAYGFSSEIEITLNGKNKASVRLTLTGKGRTNYLDQQSVYDADNSNKNVSNLFDFLKREGGNWTGHMVNQNGLWKFDLY